MYDWSLAGSAATRRSGPSSLSGFGHARVVACGQSPAPQTVGQLEHGVEANVAVAAHAGIGRLTRGITRDEWLHDSFPELVAQVEREVGKPHRVRHGPGLGHGRG